MVLLQGRFLDVGQDGLDHQSGGQLTFPSLKHAHVGLVQVGQGGACHVGSVITPAVFLTNASEDSLGRCEVRLHPLDR
jgi:hypothetical protein